MEIVEELGDLGRGSSVEDATQTAPILCLAQGPDRGDEEPRFLVKIDALDHRFLDTKQSYP